MATSTFKNATDTGVGTSFSTAYTVPASTTAVMIGMTVANLGVSQIAIEIEDDLSCICDELKRIYHEYLIQNYLSRLMSAVHCYFVPKRRMTRITNGSLKMIRNMF